MDIDMKNRETRTPPGPWPTSEATALSGSCGIGMAEQKTGHLTYTHTAFKEDGTI
jgi:hypothetical protein